MWQRIQTVFLIITIASLLIALVQPIWQVQSGDATLTLTPFYLLQDNSYAYMPYSLTAILAVAGITLAILTIRRYDNRLLQIKLGALNSLVLAGFMFSAVIFTSKLSEQHQGSVGKVWLILAGVAVISNWLAIRFIRRDERIVKESDRLR
ncbi:MAG: DUF4293 domain-containing protein [Cyclobacteriaceae bacterium]|nr:DUF4293 domain-containing protein [Cyclobacteriaceae bacterium]